ncbi:Ca-activated chloride channel family protein [Fontibacillus phaseoli]|uniref:Ca-activated chloride channel family protein n=1 Tax=Fontibacillus phaseoli TaxID=1416533 RepID=A0A369B397_9BACL|nr:VWA domain-containing protein [Fontibacillus phaseoli]RCX14927.1 Ca-activated chloride channel family protein [Fontibacillus phaseoli]
MKQIMLITDGCSNVGESPVMAAALAKQEGIIVNVVGIVDYGTIGELGSLEIAEIAKAGGGMSRLSGTQKLAQTMQMMTRKTVVQTIQHAVNKELRQILGDSSVEDLPPEKRSQVVEVIDELSETSSLEIALLIDASASMKPKLAAVEEAIRDMMLSLGARKGSSRLAVFHFPGPHSGEDAVLDLDWTTDLGTVRSIFQRLAMRGATPTGPAILKVMEFFQYGTLKGHDSKNWPEETGRGEGILGDYVV